MIDIARLAVLQGLGAGADSRYERRLAQKKFFLASELGVDAGYAFIWERHGPYSPDLADFLFENADRLFQEFPARELTENASAAIQAVNALAAEKPPHMREGDWYELLASLVFIQSRRGRYGEKLHRELMTRLPKFRADECAEAARALSKAGFSLIPA